MEELVLERLINGQKNIEVKDDMFEKEKIMRELLNNKRMYDVFYYEFMDKLVDYQVVYGDILFYETELSELVYDINEEILSENFFIINKFIKFLIRNIPWDFRLSDVIYCIENYE
jgi:hypothetical protein